jgi:hypothetical protein
MKKIPTLFIRDEENRHYVTQEPNPECAWVFAGEGVATRKYDGTCVMFDGVRWWARREVKPGKPVPENFREENFDEITQKRMGWVPIEESSFIKPFEEAEKSANGFGQWPVGTYELCGPKINGNPEGYEEHVLVEHASAVRLDFPDRSYDGIRLTIKNWPRRYEGVVFHHEDGRMAKIKAKDFRAQLDWQPLNFIPGNQGVLVCEALGLNVRQVSADPIEYLRTKNAQGEPDGAVLRFRGCGNVEKEQIEAALDIIATGKGLPK